jgi:RimJ/RimL family protein N-acetyltransferase
MKPHEGPELKGPTMTGKLVVETDRLWLREFVPEDAQAILEVGSNPLVMQYIGENRLTSVAEAEAVIRQHPMTEYQKYGFGRWAVVVKANGRVIGMTGLKHLPDLEEVDLGFRLLPEYWGMGLATEAGQASLRYGFQTLQLSRIIGLVDPANGRSVRVLEKCGLTFEKMTEFRSLQAAQYVIHARTG